MSEYAKRDHAALGAHYVRHISAMTAEALHTKSAIAGELAWRDAEIERLRRERGEPAAQVSALLDEYDELVDGQAGLREKIRELAARLEAIERAEPELCGCTETCGKEWALSAVACRKLPGRAEPCRCGPDRVSRPKGGAA